MRDNETPEEIQLAYRQAESITKGTAISLSVVIVIVMSALYVSNIRGSSDANAQGVSENKQQIIILHKNAIEAQKFQNALLNDINTRLSRMEGILKQMNRGDE